MLAFTGSLKMQFYYHLSQENCTDTFFTGKVTSSQDYCPPLSTLAGKELGIINALQ